jgi:phenylalanyl-tRNA synthetase alpha chain
LSKIRQYLPIIHHSSFTILNNEGIIVKNMADTFTQITKIRESLKAKLAKLEDKAAILRDAEFKGLLNNIAKQPAEQRAAYGRAVNELKKEILGWLAQTSSDTTNLSPIDITAPFDVNTKAQDKPRLLGSDQGSTHPLMAELDNILDIFYRMGFGAVESRQIDDDYHMFESLNFPAGHPARDDWDTFVTAEGLVAPAHTSTMQNRVLKANKKNLENDEAVAVVIPGRVFRNEDLDARHEHTFYQIEGVYVGKGVNTGHLIATLKTFLQEYYGQELDVRTQPFYFPFCKKKGCSICGQEGWIELIGCGLIHPNVLKEAGVDPKVYTGFAFGLGIDRLVMMKYNIEDIRHFESGKLEFLRQFK